MRGVITDVEPEWPTWMPTDPDSPGRIDASTMLAYGLIPEANKGAIVHAPLPTVPQPGGVTAAQPGTAADLYGQRHWEVTPAGGVRESRARLGRGRLRLVDAGRFDHNVVAMEGDAFFQPIPGGGLPVLRRALALPEEERERMRRAAHARVVAERDATAHLAALLARFFPAAGGCAGRLPGHPVPDARQPRSQATTSQLDPLEAAR
ncbi:hypothetical protein [Streptomyces rubellomurinus]|uniref:Uncharacterized protein n=1 Tax=Streptomyces rubellomurinus (strain ATCC 31215) TaxID=359131 RepID=A0A0F2TA97_STRR3|nr:hypothetical protein [Streptomyces rubellomurinus]KJS60134.1 hypothetical protein VM95_23050 [Streptomyces rubellomurinus]